MLGTFAVGVLDGDFQPRTAWRIDAFHMSKKRFFGRSFTDEQQGSISGPSVHLDGSEFRHGAISPRHILRIEIIVVANTGHGIEATSHTFAFRIFLHQHYLRLVN